MILNCPNCATRYLLSSAAIGGEGREVRCAKCQHEWYQEPEIDAENGAYEPVESDEATETAEESTEETAEDEDLDDTAYDDVDKAVRDHVADMSGLDEDDPIPEAVKPLPEGSNVPAFAEDVAKNKASLTARVTGYGLALLLIGGIVFSAILMKEKIVAHWPPAAMIYDLAQIPVLFKGENLVMESLSASVLQNDKGQDVLMVKGRVINLTGEAVDVPKMQATLRTTNGDDGESWVIDAPVDQVEPGASFAFTSNFIDIPAGVGSVNLTFIPSVSGV